MASSRDGRRRVGPGNQDSSRSAALEQLKSIKEKGGRRLESFELKLEDKIYDSLEEKEYALLVAKRRLESKDFVVEDNGLGYGDIGEEENWEVGGARDSSDEEQERRQSKRKSAAKKEGPSKKEKEFMAAAALTGKQRVSSMFAAAKRSKGENSVDIDKALEEILASVGTDNTEADKNKPLQDKAVPAASTYVDSCADTFGNRSKSIPRTRKVSDANEVDICSKQKQHTSQKKQIVNIVVDEEMPDNVLMPDDCTEKECLKVNVTDTIGRNAEKMIDVEDKKPLAERNQQQQIASVSEASSLPEAKDTTTLSFGAQIGFEDSELCDAAVLPVNGSGNLQFFLIDAYEEPFGASVGTVFLFGKVEKEGKFMSCCVVVRNMQRCVYAVPAPSVFPQPVIALLEQERQSNLKCKLQELAEDLKMELGDVLVNNNVTNFTMIPVKRSYAFERTDVPKGTHYFLKLSYPFKDKPLPSSLKGEHFTAVFGTHTSPLETLLVKRKIKGPCWLSVSNAMQTSSSSQFSWCKLEVVVNCSKDVSVAVPARSDIPHLTVASIDLKTVINQKQKVNEIVSASVVFRKDVKVDIPMPKSEWNRHEVLGHFTVVRKLEGGIYPMGFTSAVENINSNSRSNVLACESSERALLNRLLMMLHQLDPDVLVGHNISAFHLDVLLHRLQACKVPSSVWSRVGRLKRSQMPKLTGGGGSYGGGASPGAMACVAGRLLCDTYLSSRELLKEVSYTLTQLSLSQLGKERKELEPLEIPTMFESSASLLELIETAETDAWLSLSLMFHLNILPLTRQLTNISGNLWSKTLQGARAQRVEYLLLHEFYSRKFILPDKFSNTEKELAKPKRKGPQEGVDVDDEIDDGKRKKVAAYLGGLVLEPKKGLYDKYVLLLDFNSLYPSIIQEYNICFTTVERPSDGSIPLVPSPDVPGVLPQVLKNLVSRRKQVKRWLKETVDVMKSQQLDIQQQALKLTANSMYGCLGFPNSRFYAKAIAELITSQGREILQSTVDLVQNMLNHEVIYGDTDSIMINTGLDDLLAAKSIGAQVIKEVNKRYKLLEIDLDGVYKRMLLLKKKKYACVKVETNLDGTYREVIEQKGLDIVRRDWCMLSKDVGNYILRQILSEGSKEDVVNSIHNELRQLQENVRNGSIEVEKYVITKTLTKPPEAYPDGNNQPHVQVALRRKQSGRRVGCFAGDTVPYIICTEVGSSSVGALSLAERARHPEELKKEGANWQVDIEYYLSQQIHPVVSRLCAVIEGTDPARIADCLGLDASRFHHRVITTSDDREEALLSSSILDDDERYRTCEDLELLCLHCNDHFPFSGMRKMTESDSIQNPLTCPTCQNTLTPKQLANQVIASAQKFISRFHDLHLVCDEEMCGCMIRGEMMLRSLADCEKGSVCINYPRCNGRMIRQYSQSDLYKQLTHFCRLLDLTKAIEKIKDPVTKVTKEKMMKTLLGESMDFALQSAEELRNYCSFGWINLSDVCVSLH